MAFEASIPGQTPLDDISGLRDRSIRTQAQLNAAEAENIRKAVMKNLVAAPTRRSARFDLAWVCGVHAEMFGDVWQWAGEIRTTELSVGVPAHQVLPALQSLLDDLHAWAGFGMTFVEQGARLHHRAVFIHPFRNGNGRWARLVANIWLRRNGAGIVEWPEATIGAVSTIRDDYLGVVRAADAGDYEPLIAMHERYTRS